MLQWISADDLGITLGVEEDEMRVVKKPNERQPPRAATLARKHEEEIKELRERLSRLERAVQGRPAREGWAELFTPVTSGETNQ